MRIATARLWSSGLAEKRLLIAPHDLDFNDRDTRGEIAQINNTLDNAIAHDIASDGAAVAEVMDANLGTTDTQDACRLLLMASLANVPNAVMGLSIPELIAYLAEPGRDLARLKNDVLAKLATAAWYLHSNRDGKLYFRNVQNLNAKLESLVKTYQPEQAIKELRVRLEELFVPVNGWCYQRVLALPAVDEIELEQDRVTLVMTEPYSGSGLRPELRTFWEQATWRNRVAFLTGARNTYEQLLDAGKRLKAIQHILGELRGDKTPDNDPQMIQAKDLSDRITGNFHSAVRETFTTLWYPLEAGLVSADFRMKFEGNKYSGEGQVVDVLVEKQKFTDDVSGDIFRKKCEQRLFTSQSLPWSEIKKRAAMYPKWQWHRPDALDALKTDCVHRDVWREEGGFVDKGPFPQPTTGVIINETTRDDITGEATLRVAAVHADTVYYDVGAAATTASARLDGSDAEDPRATRLVPGRRFHRRASDRPRGHLAEPHHAQTPGLSERQRQTDGTARRARRGDLVYYGRLRPEAGGRGLRRPVHRPAGAPLVLAYAERDGVQSAVENIPVSWEKDETVQVDARRPAAWKRQHACGSTKDSYDFLARLGKHNAQVSGLSITISGEGSNRDWVELNMYEGKHVAPDLIEECLEALRKLQDSGQVRLTAEALHFATGQGLLDWVEEVKTALKAGEVKQ